MSPVDETAPAGAAEARREAIRRRLLAQRAGQAAVVISPRRDSERTPLSFAQQRLFFLHRLDPDHVVYNIASAVRFSGPTDPILIERALQQVVTRHEVLHTRFVEHGGELSAEVVQDVRVPVPVVDLGHLPVGEREAAALVRAREAAREPFDLARCPLLRMTLFRVGEQDYILAIALHHIIADAWTMGVFINELWTSCQDLFAGRPCSLPRPAVQYGDYALWQRRRLSGAYLEREVDWWLRRLEGVPTTTVFPPDRIRPTVQGNAGRKKVLNIPQGLVRGLEILARRRDATLFMVLLTALDILLWHWSGQQDLAVGTPIAGRDRPEIEGLLGFFANTLVLRSDLSGDPGFGELLLRVRENTLEAFDHQELPLELLVQRMDPERTTAHTPLFQTLFSMQRDRMEQFARAGLTLRHLPLDTGIARFDLSLNVVHGDSGARAIFEYRTELYDDETINAIAQQYLTLLGSIKTDPERPISALSILPEADRARLERIPPRTPPRIGGCLHQVFEGHARRNPDAVALVIPADPDQGLERRTRTYGQLNRAADRLARHLIGVGVGAELRVVLYLARGEDVVVAILGVLKAGGAYVPIDSVTPAARAAELIADADVGAVVIHRETAGRLIEERVPVVELSALDCWSVQTNEVPPTVPARSGLDNLAYIIYTSGSSGRPKGVLVSHANMAHLFAVTEAEYGFGPIDTACLFHSHGFDFSVWEMWAALAYGGRLLVVPRWLSCSPESFLRVLAEERVTVLNLTPSALRQLLATDAGGAAPLPDLRLIILGGEALDPRVLEQWFDVHGDRRPSVYNMYGITETTVHVTAERITRTHAVGSRVGSPIGRPLSDLDLRVLDSRMQPVPIGTIGEIYVGGAGVARGYLNRPGLTAQRFLPDTWSPVPGARLYRSGDLGRLLTDGSFEHHGRADDQVKLRGYRIEPGEVEYALRAMPAIKDAAVVLRHDGSGLERLLAYVVPAGEGCDTAGVREALSGVLPAYMVPAVITSIPALPLTANGKLDQHALPEPALTPVRKPTVKAEWSETEALIVEAFEEVLGCDGIGVEDGFFALGGDSILSIRLISAVRVRGIELTPRDVFEHQLPTTLANAAVRIDGRVRSRSVAGELAPGPVQRWFLELGLPDWRHWNQAVRLELKIPLLPRLAEQALEFCIARHDAMRMRFTPRRDGTWYVRVSDARAVPLQRVALHGLEDDRQKVAVSAALADAHASLDPEQGRLMRMLWFDPGAGAPGQLAVIAHHLVVDAVSWGILLEDFERVYMALRESEAPDLESVGTPFSAWLERLPGLAVSERVTAVGRRWLRALDGSAFRALPRDGEAVGNGLEVQARIIELNWSVERTSDLEAALKQGLQASLQEAILAALVDALCDWTGGSGMLIDLESHGRAGDLAGIDPSLTPGWFTAIAPVCVAYQAGAGAQAALAAARAAVEEWRPFEYSLCRYPSDGLNGLAGRLQDLPRAEVLLNYLGRASGIGSSSRLFGRPLPDFGPTRGGGNPRTHALAVRVQIEGRRLRMRWSYCPGIHDPDRIAALADHMSDTLGTLSNSGRALPADIEDLYPLTAVQAGILYHHELNHDTQAYLVQHHYELTGSLEPQVLEGAWRRVQARHAVLRTSFHWQGDGPPLQYIHAGPCPAFEYLDWRDAGSEEQGRRRDELLLQRRQAGFEVDRPPLFGVSLIRLSGQRWSMLWTYHHLILDGMSAPRVIQDLFHYYREGCGQSVTPLLELRPFREYPAWLMTRDGDAARAFWNSELAGHEIVPMLQGEPDERGLRPRRQVNFKLSPVLSRGAEALAKAEGVTLATVVQAAWALLLARYCDRRDVVFGHVLTAAEGAAEGSASAAGIYIATVPWRIRVPGRGVVGTWLRAIGTTLARTLPHAHLPLPEIREVSGLAGEGPLFETLLVFQNLALAGGGQDSGPLCVRKLRGEERSHYALMLTVSPGESLGFRLGYDTGRLTAAGALRLQTQLRTAFESLVAKPRTVPALLTVLPEKYPMPWAGESASRHPVPSARVYERIRRALERAPERIAVRWMDVEVSASALLRRADAVTLGLQRRGVVPGVLVAFALERGPEMVAAMLGISGAGAAWLPLDPSHPEGHLRTIIADAMPELLLTDLDRDWPVPVASPGDMIDGGVRSAVDKPPSEAAYVIYTSGSTGMPKGVVITEQALVTLLAGVSARIGIRSGDCLIAVTTVSFDIAALELLLPLLSDALLHIATDDEARDPGRLAAILADGSGTLMQATPATWQMLVDYGWQGSPGLRALCGGDQLPRSLAGVLCAGCSKVWNLYGPTEATIWATMVPLEAGGSVDLGTAIDHYRVYILNGDLEPVPPGALGELYIGGAGVARGYQRRPGLTARRFLPDPWSPEAGARMYATGDRVLQSEDGRLMFLGRSDNQVKVRGFRVEPGAVEAALDVHGQVRQCAVLAITDDRAVTRLEAACCTDVGVDAAGLRTFLARHLPGYMVPQRIHIVAELPLSRAGKIDRRRLVQMLDAKDRTRRDATAPRTIHEAEVAEEVRDLLGLEAVGADDDFFALGGHSLLAVQLLARLNRRRVTALSLARMLEDLRISGIASALAEMERVGGQEPPVARDAADSVPLVPAQRAMWTIEEHFGGTPWFNLSSAFEIEGKVAEPALAVALVTLLDRHQVLRGIFADIDGQPGQRFLHPEDAPGLRLLDFTRLPGPERMERLGEYQRALTRTPFALEREPPFRCEVVRIQAERYVVLFVVHHLVADAWSMRLIVEDFARAYEAAVSDDPPTLRPLRYQWSDFVAWQGESCDALFADQRDWWCVSLADAPLLRLPLDGKRGDAPQLESDRIEIRYDRDRVERLRGAARRAATTPFVTAVAALMAVLARIGGQHDLMLATEVAGRQVTGSEDIVGLFINTLLLRISLSGDPSLDEVVERVAQTFIQALAHQDLPFDALAPDLERVLGRKRSDFTHLLVLWRTQESALPASPLRITPLGASPGKRDKEMSMTTFDLLVEFEEQPELLRIDITYKVGLLRRDTVVSLADCLGAALDAVGGRPNLHLSDLSLPFPNLNGRS